MKNKLFILFIMLGCMVCLANENPLWSHCIEIDKTVGDHAVLQRERPIHICGTGEPGKAVRITLGNSNACTANVQKNGRWCAELNAMPAGGPYTLTVCGSKETPAITYHDIMIGEVWLCSGQSNMEMPVYSKSPRWRDERHEAVLKEVNGYPQLRLFNASLNKYMSPCRQQEQPIGTWAIASSQSASSFSATALHFGMELCRMHPNVPVGLIHASWSGTRIEPWISWHGYGTSSRTKEKSAVAFAQMDIRKRNELKQKAREKYRRQTEDWIASFEVASAHPEAKEQWPKPDYDDSNWSALPKAPRVLFPDNMDGVIWMRHTATIPTEWIGHELRLSLGPIDDCDWTYVNGELVGQTLIDVAKYWYVPREYLVPASIVTSDKVTIAVRVADLYAEGGFTLGEEK